MGAAVGGGPGELSVVSVAGGGQPAPGAVVDPAAPGGPGTGPAVAATGFPGPLTLDGLVLRSPDADALRLFGGTGVVLLARLDASNSAGGAGVVVDHAGGDLRLEDSRALLNLEAGFSLATADGRVEIAGSVAESNGGPGYLVAGRDVSVLSSRADANGEQGFLLEAAAGSGALDLQDVDANSNAGAGILAFPLSSTLLFAEATLDGVLAVGNQSVGLAVAAESLTAAVLTARANDGTGAGLIGHEVAVNGAIVEQNTGTGLLVQTLGAGATFALSGVTATANEQGVLALPVDPDELATGVLFGVVATGSQGVGIAIMAGRLTAALVTAAGNGSTGAAFLVSQSLDATTVSATANAGLGIGAASPGSADIDLESSVATGNQTGFLVNGGRVRLEGCTASGNGPSSSEPFAGVGFVVSADSLEAEGDFAVGNEIGWVFSDFEFSVAPELAGDEAPLGWDPGRLAPTLLVPRLGAGGGPTVPQWLVVRTSRTEGNALASMQASLREEGRLTVACSDFAGNGPSGLELATDNTVDARANFWGNPSGPTHPGNPGGSGDVVRDAVAGASGEVGYSPFLAGPATAEDCPVAAVAEIPALGPAGLALFALLTAGAALARMRRRRAPFPAG
jgi:hypothetical protein